MSFLRRAASARAFAGDRAYWVAAEKAASFASIFPEARFDSPLADIEKPPSVARRCDFGVRGRVDGACWDL